MSYSRYIGLDLHKRVVQAAILTSDGEVARWLLIEAATAAVRVPGPLQGFCLRLRAKKCHNIPYGCWHAPPGWRTTSEQDVQDMQDEPKMSSTRPLVSCPSCLSCSGPLTLPGSTQRCRTWTSNLLCVLEEPRPTPHQDPSLRSG